MAESLEEMFVATSYKRRMFVPEGSYFTTDGEAIYKMVSQNGDENQVSAAPVSMEGGQLKDGAAEKMYKYGEMVYIVEEDDGEEEE